MFGAMRRAAAVLGIALLMAACGGGSATPECATDGATLESAIFYVDLRCGTGAEVGGGDRASVEYTGTLEDGTVFDSTEDRDEPYRFLLGDPNLIEGWDAIAGMRVGGKRRIVVPPELGYAGDGLPPHIPPDATLTFEVTLLEVSSG